MSLIISIANKFATPFYWRNSVKEAFTRSNMSRYIVELHGMDNIPDFVYIETDQLASVIKTPDSVDLYARAAARLAYDPPIQRTTYFSTEVAPLSLRFFLPQLLPKGLTAFYSLMLPMKDRQQILKAIKKLDPFFVSVDYVFEEDGSHPMLRHYLQYGEVHCIFTATVQKMSQAFSALHALEKMPKVRFPFLLLESRH